MIKLLNFYCVQLENNAIIDIRFNMTNPCNSKPTRTVQTLISAIETTLQLHIAINDYTGAFYKFIPIPNSFHCNLACKEIKRSTENNELCRVFDTIEVPSLLDSQRKTLIKRCHCTFFEFIYPIVHGEILLGTIFLGPFTISDPYNISFFNQTDANDMEKADRHFISGQLPSFTSQRVEELKLLASILLAKLAQFLLEANDSIEPNMTMTRKDKITRYLSMNFSKKIQLKDLASHLALSESRTSESLHQLFGKSFPLLLNTYRIDHAKLLLVNSDFSVSDISDRCGFSDITYFHQVFKQSTNTTPNRYRSQFKKLVVT